MPAQGFANILDRASSELLTLEEQRQFPSGMQVAPQMFALMTQVRKREMDLGFPLLVLGLSVAPDASLGPDDYRLIA